MAAAGVSFSLGARRDEGARRRVGLGQERDAAARCSGSCPSPAAWSTARCSGTAATCSASRPPSCGTIRGREIAMVFQDPTSCLNPVYTIGEQIAETLRVKLGMGGRAAKDRAAELLDHVGIPAARVAARLLSARAVGRHAPARDDRDRHRLPPPAAARRRADDRARRDDPGSDPRPARRAPAGVRDGDGARLARPRRRRAELRLGRGDVRRARRRARPGDRALPHAAPPVHGRPAAGAAVDRRRRRRAGAFRRSRARRPTSPQLPEGCPFRPRCPSARDACAGGDDGARCPSARST